MEIGGKGNWTESTVKKGVRKKTLMDAIHKMVSSEWMDYYPDDFDRKFTTRKDGVNESIHLRPHFLLRKLRKFLSCNCSSII